MSSSRVDGPRQTDLLAYALDTYIAISCSENFPYIAFSFTIMQDAAGNEGQGSVAEIQPHILLVMS